MTAYKEFNKAGAVLALEAAEINTRPGIVVALEGEIVRFIIDDRPRTIDGDVFEAVPWVEVPTIQRGTGKVADSTEIVLDGRRFKSPTEENPIQVLDQVLAEALRDRPFQINTIVMDPDTGVPIGYFRLMGGQIDSTRLETEGRGLAKIKAASIRARNNRRAARIHTATDHRERFPGDGAGDSLADTVFRNGTFQWNSESAAGQGSRSTPGPVDYLGGLIRTL